MVNIPLNSVPAFLLKALNTQNNFIRRYKLASRWR